ncbi:MAG: putative C-S lyase [Armatimonadetes bacterium]|nr:putative C-S lyase [Akkermansiaceae bacterium]
MHFSARMIFDFDTVVRRRATGSIKYDRKPALDPFWVADMDFVSAPVILQALHQRVDHGIFGYSQAHRGVIDSIRMYLGNRRKVELDEDHLIHLGGLVPALSLAARAFCKDGAELMTCTPVYPPFLNVHRDVGAKLLTVDHVFINDRWEFDWEKMEQAVSERTRIFLLCNPQNSLGRVFSQAEIVKLAEFCERHGMILVSDEIHCDLIFDEQATPHYSALELPAHLAKLSITMLSPSKTWNIAGLGYAFAIIPDDSVRRKFSAARGHTLAEINALAYYAAEAAYKDGESWRLELIEYLRENRDTLVKFINHECEGLSIHSPEATYLAWIDARQLGVDNPANFFEQEAGLFLSDGVLFGWPGYVRFNFGCPRTRMLEGLEKMKAAIVKKR